LHSFEASFDHSAFVLAWLTRVGSIAAFSAATNNMVGLEVKTTSVRVRCGSENGTALARREGVVTKVKVLSMVGAIIAACRVCAGGR
jgi:hypothetical protein